MVFFDDDTVVDPHCLAEHCRAFSDPAVAATTGAVLPIRHPGYDRMPVSTEGLFVSTDPMCLDRFSVSWFERANFGGIRERRQPCISSRPVCWRRGFHEDLGLPEPMGGEEHSCLFSVGSHGLENPLPAQSAALSSGNVWN